MAGRILKVLVTLIASLPLLASFQFQALALTPECAAYYQSSGEVYVQAGDWPSIHHDAGNSGVLPEPMAAPREFRLKWSALANASVLSSPVVGDDGRIYVTATMQDFETIEGWESGILQSQLYALDAASGEIVWTRQDIMMGGMAGAPLLIRSPRGELSIIASGAGTVFAFDERGRVRWRSPMGRREVSISAHLSPDGKSVFVGTDQGSIYLKDPATGVDLIPPYRNSGFVNGNTPCMTADGTVILVGIHDGDNTDGVACAVRPDLSAGTWEIKWVFEDIHGESETSPALSSDSSRVYVGDEDAAVIALDVESGEEIWRCDLDRIAGRYYFACASIAVTAQGFLGLGLVTQTPYLDPRLVWFFDDYGFVLSRVMVGPLVSNFTEFFWGGAPRYAVILKDNGDGAEIAYMEDWKVTGGLTYSEGSGLFYFAGMQEDPATGRLEHIVVALDHLTGEAFTQPVENAYFNNISLADGALIVPIFWGGELGLPVLVREGFGLHYYESTTGP